MWGTNWGPGCEDEVTCYSGVVWCGVVGPNLFHDHHYYQQQRQLAASSTSYAGTVYDLGVNSTTSVVQQTLREEYKSGQASLDLMFCSLIERFRIVIVAIQTTWKWKLKCKKKFGKM